MRVTGYPYRTLIGWVAALALAWLIFSSPWASRWNLLLATFTIILTVAAALMLTRRLRARRHAAEPVLQAVRASLDVLPGEIRRNTPLVLVMSDMAGTMQKAFGETLVRVTDTAIWVRVDDPARLAHIADALKRWRAGQGPDAVAGLLGADQTNDAGVLNAGLERWRSAIGEGSRAVGYTLPVCVAVYAEDNGASDDCLWFGMSGEKILTQDAPATIVATRVQEYVQAASPIERAARMCRAARLDALARWGAGVLLPVLVDTQRDGFRHGRPAHVVAFGVTLAEGAPAADSLLARFIGQTTALNRVPKSGRSASYPLPEPLIRGIAQQPVRRVLPRAMAHAFAWLVLFFCAAGAASAWQNRALVARVQSDMSRYRAIDANHDAARVDALRTIKRDRDELEQYQRNGVPPRLGLGFYRGGQLLAPLNALIASYQPPAPPPSTIELDSLSLFKSGSAVLNPGSNRVLIGALEMIKAHTDKRVLVAGHTDNVGSAQTNLRLSEARAAAVRDWLADAAGMSVTRFAIQGYGDTRPKVSNDTAAGRAANRRVEITLVPDCRDARRDGQESPGHPACSLQ